MSWRITITPTAMRMLTRITDCRIREKIIAVMTFSLKSLKNRAR